MILCTVHVDGVSHSIPLPNDGGKLDFKVKFLTKPRHRFPIFSILTFRSNNWCAGNDDGRRTAMICCGCVPESRYQPCDI